MLKICLLPCIKRLTIIKFAFLWLLMKKVSLKNPLQNVPVLIMLVLDLGFLPCTPPAILLLFSLPTHQGCQHSQNPSCFPYALWLSSLSFSHPEGFIQVLWGFRALHPPLPYGGRNARKVFLPRVTSPPEICSLLKAPTLFNWHTGKAKKHLVCSIKNKFPTD